MDIRTSSLLCGIFLVVLVPKLTVYKHFVAQSLLWSALVHNQLVNSADPDETAPVGAVSSGSSLFTDSQCTWPTPFVSSTWRNNAKGDLVFSTTTMTGWSFTVGTQVVNEWQCVSTDQFESDGYLIMRSVSDFVQFVSSNYFAYLCLKMTAITDNSYRVYVYEPKQPNLDYERYLIHIDGSLSGVGSVCYEQYGATGSEYQVMIKSGSESSSTITCPWIFLGRFDYSHTTVSGTQTCTTSGDEWDLCSDRTKMAFDFSSCSTDVAYSALSDVHCVDTVPVNSDAVVTVYTEATVDGTSTFSFACFALSSGLTGASVASEHCRQDQTPSAYPTDKYGSQTGALISVTNVYELCPTCPSLDSPDGGSVSVETNGPWTVALYTCAENYALYGDASRTCQQNNTWSSAAPLCKCIAPDSPNNGNVTVSSDGSVATYTCDVGFVLQGNEERTCQTDGNAWNGTDPTCETCSTLGDPANGAVTLTQAGSTSVAMYTCNTGYSLNGEANLTCLVNGSWSNNSPSCVLCSSLTSPDLGNFSLSSDGLSSIATFACTSGYQVQGSGTLTCDSSGTWDAAEPSCICESREPPTFGTATLTSDGLNAEFSCSVGYTMLGSATSSCSLDGSSWDTTVPQCVACANLTTPTGGNITLTTNGSLTMATFTCDAGYNMVGETVAECSTDGTWSQNSTTCVLCNTLTSPTSGSINVTTDGSTSTAVYMCMAGYNLIGTAQRTCQTDGTWNGTEPHCDCEAPSAPAGGGVTVTDSLAVFTCNTNYTLSGEAVSACRSDGTGWNASEPTCVLCASLDSPFGGSVQFESATGQSTEATYSCDTGYTMSGQSTVTCGTDGTWSSTATTCVECQALPTVTNGSVTMATDGQTTSATFSCDVGSSLGEGYSPQTDCGSDGTWSVGTVSCTTCQALNDILSGQVTMDTNGTVTTATYTCVTDYQLVGTSSRLCLQNGTWTETAPECVCNDPANITDGTVSVSGDGLTATYTCNTGYTMDGASTSTCQTDGTGWSTNPPTCVTCQSLSDTASGSLTLTTDGTITTATYTCDTGYTVNGTSTRSCQTDGAWTSEAPTCVSCANLTDPSSGSFNLSFNGTNTLAQLTCVTGYSVVGTALLVCQPDGSWDAATPSCVCDEPEPPANGSVSLSGDGYTATYSCDTGFTLDGINSRTCQSDGQSWSGQSPTCVGCSDISTDSGGTVTLTSNGSVTQSVYSCATGYTLSGDQSRTCGTDGQWSGGSATCSACATLQDPDSGSVTLSSDGSTTTASYTCSTGYYLHGENTSQCSTDGTWTNPSPTCVCVPTSAPTNGSLTIANGNMTLTFTCDTGFILSGSTERVCQTDGTGWSGTQPSCTTCVTLATPANGTVTLTSDGTTTAAQFTCNEGFTLDGTSVLTCAEDGTWDTQSPQCVGCPVLGDISSGSVAMATNGTTSVASFTCVSGYSVVGSSAISCLTSGAWDEESPTCVCDTPSVPTDGTITVSGDGSQVSYECAAGTTLSGLSVRQCNTDGSGWQGADPQCVSCPTLTSPDGGTVNTSSDGQSTSALFTCDLGYSINGSSTVTCTEAGSWDNDQPSCAQCPSLASPSSGSVVTSTNSIVTQADFSCVTGYTLVGSSVLTCQSDESWDTNTPTCVCNPPSTPSNGANQLSDGGMTVTYTCSSGYTLQGVSNRVCQTDGSGWNEAQPSCTTCDPLNSLVGGDITMETSGTVTQAVFTCDVGYTISGDTSLTCRSDGTWDISAPTCEVCDSLSSPTGGSVLVTSTDSVSVASYACDLGYTLNGPATLTCRTDGSWDLGAPSCSKCSTLTSPDSGSVDMTTNSTTTTATISCVTGYYVAGESVITCGTDGSWSTETPVCVCDALVSPANGSMTLSANNLTATFTCDVGNSLVGSSTSDCMANGTGWTSATPTCVGCPALTSVDEGSVETNTDGTTTTSSVTCSLGATVSGTVTISCESDGSWTDSQPVCVQCPNLTSPNNGDVVTETNGTVTMATYICDVNYTLAGDNNAICLSNGSWDISPPTCELCDTVAEIASGSTVLSSSGTVTMATYSCGEGYFLSGDQTVTCLQDGTWNSSQPTCICDEPSPPVDGSLWISANGMSAVSYCNTGYTMSGTANNTCSTNGAGWTSAHPTCVQCQSQASPLNGNVSQYTDGTATYAVYSCDQGYSLSSSVSVVTCTDSGQWDQSSFSCVQCSTLVAPSSGSVQISSDGSVSLATYSCLQGYSLQGNSERTCQTDGTWNGSSPSCVCNTPSSPSNGNVTVSADLLTSSYTCDTSYSLSGVSVRLCADDGTGWSDSEPSCVPCNTLSTISGGSVELSSDGQTTTAQVTCNTGYTITGSRGLQCRSDGTWNSSAPQCVLCASLSTSSDGSYSLASDGQSTTVTFECDSGFTLSGSSVSTCTTAGTWTQSEPTCVSCNSLGDPDSGSVTLGTNGTTTSATYVCNSGYHIVGESVLHCTDSGTWSATESSCVCDEPLTPAYGNMTIQDSGYSVSYTCSEGYSLNGNDVRTCSTNGTGWTGSDPSCVQCSGLSAPSNGSVVTSSDGTTTYVSVGCDVGYTATSSVNLTCQSDGTYDLTVPACQACSALQSPDNGDTVLSSTGSVTMATFSCDLGYSLAGNQLLTCQSDGSWSDASPTCVLCESFQNISSGSYSMNTNGTTSTVTAQCVTGYSLQGSETVHCTQTGAWTEIPACLCDDPAAPSFGQVTADGTQATFSCDSGYTLNGDTASTCQPDGSGWDTTTPTCVQCESQSTIEGGSSYTDTNGSSTFVTYTCPVGSTLSGESEATCGSNGQWSATVPSCTTCDSLETPDSGLITTETDNLTTNAVYSCVSGYDLIGVSLRTCLSNGTWTNSTPSCVCSVPETPLNGAVSVSSDRTTVTYSCTTGYTLTGVDTRTCQTEEAGWTGSSPTCTVCTTLNVPSGGNVAMETDGTMTTATFTCDQGYTMDGQTTLACRDDGSWNSTSPTCVQCDSVTTVSGGGYSVSTDGQTSSVQFTCDDGYTLTGVTQLTCLSSGQWSGQSPTCISCPSLGSPDSGQVATSTNGTATVAEFTCMSGYYLHGSSSLICLTTGQWDTESPECRCTPPSNVTAGTYSVSDDGSVVTYTCEEGYTLNGSQSRICQGAGLGWTGYQPSCVQCEVVDSVSGGTSITTTNGSVTMTTYQCEVGASLLGSDNSECGSDGTWTYTTPTCVSCPELLSPDHGNVSTETNGTVTVGTYTCGVGYSMDGTQIAYCQIDGSWSSNQPSCVTCQSLGSIDSGSVSLTTDGATTSATYSCVTGYQLTGNDVLLCRTDSTWDAASPTCVCTAPLSVVNGNYTISSDGMSVTYTCDVGFSMTGSADRSCDSSGAGWTGSPPTCAQCEALSGLDNGALSYSTDGESTTITYSCGSGYSISDVDGVTATCSDDGTWNLVTNTTVSCVSCSTLDSINNGNITVQSDGVYSIATYECLPDYTLYGNSQRTCVTGEWNGTVPSCLCSFSTFFQNGEVTSNGSTISYSCSSGYTLVGSSTGVCQETGLGWSVTEPTCVVCETLSTPTGGNMTLTTDGSQTAATFTCDVGYTMTGQSTLTCRSDGTWDSSPPSCGTSCSALSQPVGGSVALETDGLTTSALYTCNAQYTLLGAQQLTCRSDGSWDYTESSCVGCGDLSPPASGYIQTSTDGTTSAANYSCHADYYLDGSSQATCLTSGSWSATPPTCICNVPPSIANGSIELSEDGMTATFSCAEGFTLNGDNSTTCQTDYTGWSPYTVQCVSCGDVPEVSNRTSTLSTDGQVTTLSFTCNVGYSVSGVATVTCLTNGSWEADFPDCVGCGVLDTVENGSYSLSTDGSTTIAQFACDLGFSLKGDNLLACSSNGGWNASVPDCVACSTVGAPSSGSQLQSTDGLTSTVSFSCESGYHLVGDTTIACQTDGTWNNTTPSCVCDIPSAPTNGSVSSVGDGMTAEYSCDTGSTLVGEAVRSCSDNGTGWLNSPPTCVQCEDLSTVGDGSYTLASNGTTTVVTYTCQSGYSLSGSTQVTCGSDGTWDVTAPTCVSCDSLADPDSGNVSIATNGSLTSAQYACDQGYYLEGDTVRICTDLGTWDGEQPQCLCTSPANPADGTVSSDGVTASYSCDVGFSLYGESARVCQNNSLGWNGSDPECKACSSLNAVAGGSVSMVTDGSTTSAVYTCSEGYSVSGSTTINCRSDGTWDFTDTSCVSCETLSVPSHGAIDLSTDGATTMADVTCETGYSLSGTGQLSCRADGSWDFTVPSCVICSTLSNPASGYVNISTNGSVTAAQYTCVAGYHSNGETTRTCNNVGTWSGEEPTCRCDSPLTPDNGSMVLSSDESSATFTCESGFSLVGSTVLTCQSDGTGWNGTEPTCVLCEDFDPSFNGTVTIATDGETTSALLVCGLGSTLTGSASIACQEDGTWQTQSTLTCVTCEGLQDPENGTVTLETNGTETVANFTCDNGFTMSGNSNISCMDNGEWSGVAPSCVQCSATDTPTSGTLNYSTNDYTTVATVACMSGYHVVGTNPITCLTDGTWGDDIPSCICDATGSPVNGTSVLSNDGSDVTFSCDVGFTLLGESNATCGTDGSGWDNSVPTCAQCVPLTNISNGFVTVTSDGTATEATYSCDSGYSLLGDRVRECTVNGSWTLAAPECVLCPSLEAPSSGFLNVTTNGTISSGSYTCESGYNLQGDSQRLCQTDGTWTSTQPSCECQLPAAPDNGEVIFGSDASISEYSCNAGYTLQGTTQRHCQNDGSGWNDTAPVCVACGTLVSSAGVVYDISTDGATTTVEYSCDLGYTMSGSPNLTCRDDGTWNVEAPTCITCGTLSSPQGGQVNLTTDGGTTQAHVTCDTGYTVSGTTTLTCRSDGSWDFTVPTCAQCPTLTSPFGGSVNMATDGHTTTGTYTCLSGYYLEGTSLLTCEVNGNWSDTEPLCKCDPPSAVQDGAFEISTDGYTVTYTCQSGYTLNGDSNRTCLDGGTGWSGTQPSCTGCEALTAVTNGSYTVSTDGLTTTVTYTCGTGYTLSGQSQATCSSNGTWEFEAPVCEMCSSQDTPGNGSTELISNGTVTSAVFECESGYTLQGQAQVTCLDDGTWSSDIPMCVACPSLSQPDNGVVVTATNGTVTIATYSCETGYSLSGSQQLTCTETGTWDNTEPTCDCDAFADPANGQMTVTNNGTTAVYTCDEGYTLVGEVEQTCNTQGTGNSTSAPSCEACATLANIPGATVTMATDGTTTYASVQCDSGYTVSGQTNLTCRSDGTWDVDLPSCVVCDTVDVPVNGALTLTSTASVTVASVTCDVGSTLNGSPTLSCRTDGSWDFSTPACSKCSSLSDPSSGVVSVSTDGHVSRASYACDAGYYLDGTANITCNTSGVWETDPPVCKCDAPSAVQDGAFEISTDGYTVTYSCQSGYTLNGESNRTCLDGGAGWSGTQPSCTGCEALTVVTDGSYTVSTDGLTTTVTYSCGTGYTLSGQSEATCSSNGTWEFEAPVCEMCSSQDTPGNGSSELISNGTVTSAVFECESGYTLQGQVQLACLDNGTWSSDIPTCVACPSLSQPDNGLVVTATNGTVTIATYSCDTGYSLAGSQQLTCTEAGTWDNTEPTCDCDAFADPANGQMAVTNNGTKAMYTCDEGYTLVGEVEQTCNSQGTGNTTSAPSCEACATLANIPGATVTMATDGTTTYASVQCDSGYTISGQTNLTCRSDGTWDVDLPSCVVCDTIDVPVNGALTLTSAASVTVASITCDVGSTLKGSPTLTCRTDGSWDFSTPTCSMCSSLSDPSSGAVTASTDGQVSRASYACDAEYYLDGTANITCNTSGVWETDPPVCKCDPPSAVQDGAYEISTDGYTVTYSCQSGYTLNGDSNRTCLDGGAGWSGTPPSCTGCEALTLVTNGSYTVSTDGLTTTVTYSCGTGYTLSGQSEATCWSNGTWEFETPVCEMCSSLDALGNGSSDLVSNGTVTSARFGCDSGHTLQGQAEVTCLDNGTWSSEVPTCVACPSLSQPDNGAVVTATNGTVTIATYSCDTGYSLSGSQQLTCTEAGTWDNTEPTCDCDAFADPANGQMAVTNNGTTAVYTCDEGYTLVGEVEQTCNSQGTGNTTSAPSCEACATLANIPGATITMETDGTTTHASVQCDSGYTVSGQTNLTCRSDGTWNVDLPSCVVCDTVDIPVNGALTLTSTASVTVASITCDVGSTLNGSPTLTCRTDGSWDFSTPTCSMCSSLSDPSSGVVSVSTDGHVSRASYACDAGYYLDGTANITCNTSGMWETDPPVCNCMDPPSIDNGTFVVSAIGSTVQYSCELGYSLSGQVTRSCDSSGNGWNGTSPECVKCEDVYDPVNGTVSITTDGVNTMVSFSCDEGSTMNGSALSTCIANGTWDNQQPTCDLCNGLDTPSNGTIAYQTDNTTTLAYVQCDTGFTATGTSVITCQAGGVWDTTVPTCVQCPDLSPPDNGNVDLATNGSVTMATYSCNSNYIIVGSEESLCNDLGEWTESSPTCACEAFTEPANGAIVISDNGTQASYSCQAGYTLSGEEIKECEAVADFTQPSCVTCATLTTTAGSSYSYSTNGSATMATYVCNTGYTMVGQSTVTCRSDGTWDSQSPSCVTCASLSIPTGATVNFTSSGEITQAQFFCSNGYSLVGARTLTCRTDGSWDFSEPLCMDCPDLSDPSAGNVTMTTDGYTTEAEFTCVDGYYIDGAVLLTCNSSGLWNYDPPLCKCDSVASPNNGEANVSADGYSAAYTCGLDYTMNGTANRTCDSQGAGWSGQEPVCVSCAGIVISANLSVLLQTNGTETSATFTCDTGFSMSGAATSVCLQDGTWSEETPSCVQCASLESVTNGSSTFSSDGTTTQTSYECEEGYTLVGATTLDCDSSGTWSADPPYCVSCASLDGISNGQMSVTTNGTVTTATYSCDAGYSVSGYSVLLCSTTGSWDHNEPECVCDTFTSVTNGQLNISDNGTEATYTCDEGYTLSGEAMITCNIPSTTQTSTAPVCTSCETLDVPAGSTVTTSTDGQTTTATVECGVGYVISGQSSLTCRADGTWNVALPSCVTCSALSQPAGGNVSMETDGSTTVARFICDTGYTLSGSDQLTCRADGSWDLNSPTCVVCPNIETPSSGNLTLSTDGYITTATVSCLPGYYADGSVTLTCSESGTWSDEVAVCKCDLLPNITSGSVSIEASGLVAVYSCVSGFTLSGNANRSCDTGGNGWLGDTPTCTQCSNITSSNNMTVTLSTDGLVTIVTYQCDNGYSLSGDASGTCNSDGTWTVQQPTCEQCADLLAPSNGDVDFTTNGTLTRADFTCDTGYTLNGDTEALCQAGGTWSADTPLCDFCPVLTDPFNGQVETTSNGTVTMATFSCSTGYNISGSPTLTCGTGGTWSDNLPTCFCDVFVTPSNGNMTVSADGTTATYTCGRGYTLSGETEHTCSTSPSAVECVLCQTLTSTAGASVLLSSNGTGTTATFSCDTGYKMAGTEELTCRTDGSWDIEPPTCVVCQTLGSPTGGSVSLSSNGRDTQASFTCVSGFTLLGQDTLSCKTDGTWDFEEPTCVCDTPSTPDHATLTISDDGLTASYTCDVGFSMSGDSELQCSINGSGWQGEQPNCVACPDISISNSVNVTLLSDGIVTRAEILCDSGYSLSDTSNVTCLFNGSWDRDLPSCVSCPSLTTTGGLAYQLVSDGISTTADFSCATGYSINGAMQVLCTRNGSWDMTQPICVAAPEDGDTGGDAATGAAIAFGILFGIAFILLLLLAWRFWKLREKLKAANKSTLYKSALRPSEDGRKSIMSIPELDEIVLTNAKAPISHYRHVTDMGRASSSLAPMSHSRSVISSPTSMSSSPAPRSHFAHPKSITRLSSPNPSFSFSDGLSSKFSSPLPQQIVTPRSDSPRSFAVPKINIDTMLPGRQSPAKSLAKSLDKLAPPKTSSMSERTQPPRDGSPLPQQILTPRDPPLQDGNSPYSVKRGMKKKKEINDTGASSLTINSGKRPKPRSVSPHFQKVTDGSVKDMDC